jgi:uncharacterized protein with GYD domain
MAQHYIMLIRFTDQGIKNIKDTTRRADVGILEAPNDEAAMEFGLRVGSLGNIRTTTLKAFTEEEIARVVGKLG